MLTPLRKSPPRRCLPAARPPDSVPAPPRRRLPRGYCTVAYLRSLPDWSFQVLLSSNEIVAVNPLAPIVHLVSESEWYCLLREEMELGDTFLEKVGAFFRVLGRYAFRLAILAVVLAFLVFYTLSRG